MIVTDAYLRRKIKESLLEGTFGSVSMGSNNQSNNNGVDDDTSQENTINPDNSASIEGDEFIVHGVRFQSMPALGAGNTAIRLYQSAEAAGQSNVAGSWEKSSEGREWISNNIYDASKPGSGLKYGKLLGTPNESFWSSWFFSVCYKGFKSEGGRGSNHFDYGADEGLVKRQDILKNPDNYQGKVVFVTFSLNEAPVFKGDAVFGFRDGSGSRLSDIASGKPSHMRIFGDNNGTVYGGNESSRVGKGSVSLSSNNTVKPGQKYGKESYVAIYKRVKVIGRVNEV